MHLPSPLWLTAAVLAAAVSLPAAEKLDLQRTAPVPADQPVPIQDFFRPLMLKEPILNPSGTHVAAIITVGASGHQLMVHDLKTQKSNYVGSIGDKDLYQVQWIGNSRVMFGLSAAKLYGIGLLAADIDNLNGAYPLLQYYASRVIAIPRGDRGHPLVWNRHDSLETQRDVGAAIVNTTLKKGVIINLLAADADYSSAMEARDNNDRHIISRYPVPPGGVTYSYLADREGRLAYAFTSADGRLALHRLDGDQWVKCPVDLAAVEVVDCGDDPGKLVVIGPRQEGQPRALQLLEAATGQLGEVLLQDKAYDFAGWLYRRPKTNEILGARFQRNGPRAVWFTDEYRNLQKMLDGLFPGLSVSIIGSDEAENMFLVATFSDRQPVIYQIVDLSKNSVGLLKNSAPWIDPKRMQPQNVIKFRTRDGRQLDAYLTLPAGATPQNLPPLVVLPHGGPWARDNWGFDREAQFLASRGYAVLKPNYRGSTGYNWMFPREDEWDFRKMHDDVTDATKAISASGLVDPSRIAIMGTSFGGYLAVSGAVNEPQLYRCAITIAGVFDWEAQLKDQKYDQYDNPSFGVMMLRLGNPAAQREKFDAISPGRHVDQIRIPVFISAGTEDQVVEVSQSNRLIAALERSKVPHEAFIARNEGHGMGHLDNEVELYSRIEVFLAKNLRPKLAPLPETGGK